MESPPVLFSCYFASSPDEARGQEIGSEDVRGTAGWGGDLGDPGFW